ncbi:RdgB/HAM1 family non-canonical purine NTP pyrophosphatase [Leptospira ognonensis]|uniref:dITP/XTP pyrophosphatase n=1 Tax=Leptospira ognonensis TaxID=2484945 RepID=A0A4R9K9P6_9LEPT|nr:RdgB/HAM1 family non-canonical purine NTP pyrophosphatase [Leptospira ognonensis]TGL62170.1 RdgB/HAM1 family non-canonical purine NTP pyrophosphatase [Leptospira ognonensis]
MGKIIAFASGSEHKLKEVRAILSPLGIKVLSPKELGVSFNPEETETTFVGNSFIKSRELFRLSGLPSVADDSGICVEALNGRPGVYSARYGSLEFSDKDRALFLLQELGQNPNRIANYTCVITYVDGMIEKSFEGNVFGEISFEYDDKGKFGFGYDPIFYYPPLNKRFSEVSEAEKNKVSHRALAMNQFLQWLKK